MKMTTTKKKAKEISKKITFRDWKPVRRGRIYCSPACGFDCTHDAFLAATEAANNLCKKLGKGWKPRVWENIGWHWQVVNGLIEVNPHKIPKNTFFDNIPKIVFSAWLQTSPQIITDYHPTSAKALNALRGKIQQRQLELMHASKLIQDVLA